MASRIPPFIINWAGALDPAVDLVAGTTPPPRLEYLVALNARLQAAAIGPYVGTGLNTRFERGSGNPFLAQQEVNVATSALRGKWSRSNGTAKGTPDATDTVGASSGTGANDHVVVPSPFGSGTDKMGTSHWGLCEVVSGSEDFDAAPAAAVDRMFESPTATALTSPANEAFEVLNAVGFCVVPYLVGDLGAP